MNLRPIGSNMTELTIKNSHCRDCANEDGDIKMLFSYSTPVAYSTVKEDGIRLFFRTSQFYSVTTSRHINKWLNGQDAEKVEQYVIDDVVDGNGH